ncbi:MAG: hypothetical protein QW767_04795 [Thermoprotei archaeon]
MYWASLILIILGVGLLVGSAYDSVANLKKNTHKEVMSHYNDELYVSSKLTFASLTELTVRVSPYNSSSISGKGYLVSASNFTRINSTNIEDYALYPSGRSDYVYSFSNLTGSYYFVIISNQTPLITLVTVSPSVANRDIDAAGAGVVLLAFGIVIAAVSRQIPSLLERRRAYSQQS